MQVRPAGETADESVTVPVNALIEPTVIVDVPVAPARTVTVVGDAVTEKSGTATL